MLKFGREPFLECSSKGDKMFSAFYAKLKLYDGRSIEDIYQSNKILIDESIDTTHWKDKKGKPYINRCHASKLYDELWVQYFFENPHLIDVINEYKGFSDIFGQEGHNCQALTIYNIRKGIVKLRTTVVNIYKEKYDVYCGRPGKGQDGYFGNPYREGTREENIQRFIEYFYDRLEKDLVYKEKVMELKGKRLGCFCSPKLCHCHVMADWIDYGI